jgi:hypothetical protein
VSFKALGFYSAQKLSANHAMNVMEAYIASCLEDGSEVDLGPEKL